MIVAYDGRGFHGFAPNPGVRTVAGELAEALERGLRHPVELTGAGRTDAGVHARGQVVSFDAVAEGLDLDRLQRSLNKMLGPEIAVVDAAIAENGFDARHSARSRRYRYTILNTPWPDPFWAGRAWHVERPLDVELLRLGADALIGDHDFASFCRAPDGDVSVSLVRRVIDARWDDRGDGLLHFWIEATAFCHQMVRSVVGTLVDVGSGRKRAGDVLGILAARDRQAAGPVAPPDGLCLWSVHYDSRK
jgi:tRNA pseudouridine38-40 synthase